MCEKNEAYAHCRRCESAWAICDHEWLPSDLMKNIFSFVGKGSYYFIGQVSKDFCLNYLTFDVIEDKFAHKMDYFQAIDRIRVK